MTFPWVTWVAFAAAWMVAVAAFLGRRRPPNATIAAVFATSAIASTVMLLLALRGGPNLWVAFLWPVLHATFWSWGVAERKLHAGLAIASVLLVSWLTSLNAPEPAAITGPYAAVVIVCMVWMSKYRGTLLEAGIWMYYAPSIVGLLMSDKGALFILARWAHLSGTAVIAWWMWSQYRSARKASQTRSPPLSLESQP